MPVIQVHNHDRYWHMYTLVTSTWQCIGYWEINVYTHAYVHQKLFSVDFCNWPDSRRQLCDTQQRKLFGRIYYCRGCRHACCRHYSTTDCYFRISWGYLSLKVLAWNRKRANLNVEMKLNVTHLYKYFSLVLLVHLLSRAHHYFNDCCMHCSSNISQKNCKHMHAWSAFESWQHTSYSPIIVMHDWNTFFGWSE